MDACKPGDRVSVVGVYRPVPPRAQGSMSGLFKAQVVGVGLQQMSRQAGAAAMGALWCWGGVSIVVLGRAGVDIGVWGRA